MTPEEIDAEIKRLTELRQAAAKPAPRGRPALTEDELYEREMSRKRAKQRAAEDFKREEDERKLQATFDNMPPTHRGLWRYGQFVIAVSDGGTKGLSFMRLDEGVIVPPAMPINKLEVGQWQSIEFDPVTGLTFEQLQAGLNLMPAVSVKMRSETDEHYRQTEIYTARKAALAKIGRFPCANIWCPSALDVGSFYKFCKTCEAKMKETGKNTLGRLDMG